MAKIIGIDLGTTNSCVAVMEGGEPTVIPNRDGNRVTASVVAFTDKGDRLVGQTAKRQAVTNPRHTVFSIKRFMGRRHSEVSDEEKNDPLRSHGGLAEELVKVKLHDKEYTPPELSALILQELKETAEELPRREGHRSGDHGAGVLQRQPAPGHQRCRHHRRPRGEADHQRADGGSARLRLSTSKGTPNASRSTTSAAVPSISRSSRWTKASSRCSPPTATPDLGGDDFDEVLINHIADEFKKEQGIDLREDLMALQRLKEAAEKAKCELSSRNPPPTSTCPSSPPTPPGPKHLQMEITRATFENLASRYSSIALVKPLRDGALRRRRQRQPDRRGDPRRGLDANSRRSRKIVQKDLRQGAESLGEPRRGGRHGRCHPRGNPRR